MINPRAFVSVSRKYTAQEVSHSVKFDQDGVAIELPLDKFMHAVAQEITIKFTRGQLLKMLYSQPDLNLEEQLKAAAEAVTGDMKGQTIY